MKKLLTIILMLMSVLVTQAQQVSHTIQRGETLESIAQKHQVSVDALKQANPDAVDVFYVGMKLIIPRETISPTVSTPSETIYPAISTPSEEGTQSVHKDITKKENSPREEGERKSSAFEIGYTAGRFDGVKETGSYGLGMTFLPWNIVDKLYAGFHLSPFSFNFGLVDSDFVTDIIKLGPAIGYYFTPNIFVALPVVALCSLSFKDPETGKSKTMTEWGMACAPSIYIGKKFGVYVGPFFSMGFKGKTKVDCGFRAGFYF